MTACSVALDEIAEATGASGHGGAEKAISFINELLFLDATEVAVRDMCEQVMQELENIKTDMDTSFALVESVLATDEIKTVRSLAETKWSEDVDNVILAANATNALKWYQQYLTFKRTDIRNSYEDTENIMGHVVVPEMPVARYFIERKQSATDIAILTICRNAGEGDDRKAADGEYRDIAHPINSATRGEIQSMILTKYEETMAQEEAETLDEQYAF